MPGTCRWHGEFDGERCQGQTARKTPCKTPPNRPDKPVNENPLLSLSSLLVAEGALPTHDFTAEELAGVVGGAIQAVFKLAHEDEEQLIRGVRAGFHGSALLARLKGWITSAQPDPRGEADFTPVYIDTIAADA